MRVKKLDDPEGWELLLGGRKMNLQQARAAGYCAYAHLEERVDSRGYTFVILDCEGCDAKLSCLRLSRFVEKELNRPPTIRDRRATIGDRLAEVGSSFKR